MIRNQRRNMENFTYRSRSMLTLKRARILIIALTFASHLEGAEALTILAPISTCGAWNLGTQKEKYAAKMWAFGYLNALNSIVAGEQQAKYGNDFDALADTDPLSIESAIDKFCSANPTASSQDSMNSVFNQLTKRKKNE